MVQRPVASAADVPLGGATVRAAVARAYAALDPRVAIAVILGGYLVLGFTVLGFNRTPAQALYTSAACCGLEVVLTRLFKHRWIWPLSALITSLSLSILLNYSHDPWLLFVPVFFAIGSKYVLTFDGRHVFNPAQAGVTFSLLATSELITAAPAYQWNGIGSMSVFIVMLGLTFLMPKVKRGPLVVSFLLSFTVLTAIRAFVMRWHLPFETLFLGTLSSPAFFLFTFFMITDPATSPNEPKAQVKAGMLLALIDLAFHLRQSYFTFFYAASLLALLRLLSAHWGALRARKAPLSYVWERAVASGYWRRPATLLGLGAAGVLGYKGLIAPELPMARIDWRLERVPAATSQIDPAFGDVLERIDPGIRHLAKWLFSVGDAVASGDFDGDGKVDLFFTFPLKVDRERAALYRNLGDFRFERVPLPAIDDQIRQVERYGLPSGALFVDYDDDGDLDLFVARASGTPLLLQNQLFERGVAEWVDVSERVGLARFGNVIGANFVDLDRDGKLDLFLGQVLPEQLPGYDHDAPLDLFHLPAPEYEGDVRRYAFMHSSWHMADNGGVNLLYLQDAEHHFVRQDPLAWGMPETRWSLAIGTADLDQDGYTDLYVANDFGPDDLYLNQAGKHLDNVKGTLFGSIGRDTYKGMNASIGDLDQNGWLDVYISNVHHALQAEGSLLWTFGPAQEPGGRPRIEDRATQLGVLNEQRFGWGASIADFDNDGLQDIAQANGMVDDSIDKRFERCPDYWYVNEKVARSPPSIHVQANLWGDIRGFCIYGKERNRLYLNRGTGRGRRFLDVAEAVGMGEVDNSRGMAAVDLDNDGRLDLVVTHQFGPPSIYKNVALPGAAPVHFLGLQLLGDGVSCNQSAIGSTVRVSQKGPDGVTVQLQEAQVATGFSGQNDGRLHFGLGPSDAPVDVEVTWCGQRRSQHTGLAVDRYLTIEMPSDPSVR